jgi:hypothetical protein
MDEADRQAGSRKRPVNHIPIMPTSPTYQMIAAELINRSLKDQLTLGIRQGDRCKKVLKVVFTPKSADFYIAFPYFKANSFRCGLRSNDGRESATFETNVAVGESAVPVKVSFHESGRVHFRALSRDLSRVNLATINSTPIGRLNNNHILTVEIEGLASFVDASEGDKEKGHFVAISVPAECERVKVVVFAGFGETLDGGYKVNGQVLPPSLSLAFARPTLTTPLRIGFYVFGSTSLQPENVRAAYLLATTGYVLAPDKTDFLFLQAND